MKKKFDESALMRALLTNPREAYELARELGSAIDAITVYEKIHLYPEQAHASRSKLGYADAKAKVVLGILCNLYKKTGLKILTGYVGEDERLDFIQDLDDFFNELYATGEESQAV